MSMSKILEHVNFSQVGFVVNDIEKTKQVYAALFGVEAPPTSTGGEYEVTRCSIAGQPAPDAKCKLAFFDLRPGVQLELIEPNEAHSVWRDILNEKGEGIHHIAFNVDDTDAVVKILTEEYGATVEQHGIYGDGSGQYTYLNAQETLKCRIELLESFRK